MNVTFTKDSITVVISIDNSVIYDLARDIASDNGLDIDTFRAVTMQI